MEDVKKNEDYVEQEFNKYLATLGNPSFPMSTVIINAKFKAPIFEAKVMALAYSRVAKAVREQEGLRVRIYADEVEKGLKRKGNSGSIYKDLEKLAKFMISNRSIGFTDPVNKRFSYMNIINWAHYENGALDIYFNYAAEHFLLDYKGGFTRLELETLLSFKSVYSFRLYQLLKSRTYLHKNKGEDKECYEIPFDIAELKLCLGIVNANYHNITTLLTDSEYPDYERAVELAPEKIYADWRDFKKCVIDVAKKEINERTNMGIEYSTDSKRGKKGKIREIVFTVTYKNNNIYQEDDDQQEQTSKNLDSEQQVIVDTIAAYLEKVSLNFTEKDIINMAEAAEFDAEVAKEAIDSYIVYNKTHEVLNIVGFLVKACREKYTYKGAKKKSPIMQQYYDIEEIEREAREELRQYANMQSKNKFGFPQRDYDFEALERELMNNGSEEHTPEVPEDEETRRMRTREYDYEQLERDLCRNGVSEEITYQAPSEEKENGIAELASKYGIPQEELLQAIHQTMEEKTDEIEGQLSFFDQLV